MVSVLVMQDLIWCFKMVICLLYSSNHLNQLPNISFAISLIDSISIYNKNKSNKSYTGEQPTTHTTSQHSLAQENQRLIWTALCTVEPDLSGNQTVHLVGSTIVSNGAKTVPEKSTILAMK